MISTSYSTLLKTLLLFTTMVAASNVQAQTLEEYITEGLGNNLVLKQKNISIQQAEQSLQIAKSYFLPSVSLYADYTSGDGGRSIGIPIGDLLNPVYTSLNQLTQSDAFPRVENVEQNFFPKDFHDVRVRTSVPLFNSDLHAARNIQSQQVVLKQYEVDAYKRQLVFEIKKAYYTLLSFEAAVATYESAVSLVRKNHEVNESLFRNGKILQANVLRTKSELERVNAELNSANNQLINARHYFNFLLNRDLNSEVHTQPLDSLSLVVDSVTTPNGNREELQMVKISRDINQSALRMSRMSRLPKINAFLDLGTQSEGWKYNDGTRYYLAGIQLSVPVFQGRRNDLAIRQNKLEIEKTDASISNTAKELEMATATANNKLKTTVANYTAARNQLQAADSYFRLVDKGYREGVNTLIEFLDARNQFTASALQLNIRQLEVLTAQAQVERETASYPLSK